MFAGVQKVGEFLWSKLRSKSRFLEQLSELDARSKFMVNRVREFNVWWGVIRITIVEIQRRGGTLERRRTRARLRSVGADASQRLCPRAV